MQHISVALGTIYHLSPGRILLISCYTHAYKMPKTPSTVVHTTVIMTLLSYTYRVQLVAARRSVVPVCCVYLRRFLDVGEQVGECKGLSFCPLMPA